MYIIYLDRIHGFIDDWENNKLGKIYLLLLKVSHVFFLIDFLLRVITAKQIKAYLLSIDSFVEIFTIVPFLAIGLTKKDLNGDWFRFCMMLDTLRTM